MISLLDIVGVILNSEIELVWIVILLLIVIVLGDVLGFRMLVMVRLLLIVFVDLNVVFWWIRICDVLIVDFVRLMSCLLVRLVLLSVVVFDIVVKLLDIVKFLMFEMVLNVIGVVLLLFDIVIVLVLLLLLIELVKFLVIVKWLLFVLNCNSGVVSEVFVMMVRLVVEVMWL